MACVLHVFLPQSPEERFDYAKQLKQVVDELQKVSAYRLYQEGINLFVGHHVHECILQSHYLGAVCGL